MILDLTKLTSSTDTLMNALLEENRRLRAELESSAKVEEAALVLIKLLNKCQLYGPADAVREASEKLHEIIRAYDAQRAAALEAPEAARGKGETDG